MLTRTFALLFKIFLAGVMLAGATAWAAKGGPSGGGGGGGGGGTATTGILPGEDTTYAIEAEYSCMTGGCHETNTNLVTQHSNSLMTHVMVKCNTCHGTHTRSELGLPKPNLTGYHPGIGAIGYIVGKDRCLTCHSAQLNSGTGHPNNPSSCTGCHAPHMFLK